MNEAAKRIVDIELDGEPYGMLLTAKATLEVGKNIEDISKFQRPNGEEHTREELINMFDDASSLVVSLINGWIDYINFKNKPIKRERITVEDLQALIRIDEFPELIKKALEAVELGGNKYVESAVQNPKN